MFTVWVIAMGLAAMLAELCAVAGRSVSRSSNVCGDVSRSGHSPADVRENTIRPARPVLTGRRAGGVAGWRELAGRHIVCAGPDGRCQMVAPGARAVRLGWIPVGVRSAELTAIT